MEQTNNTKQNKQKLIYAARHEKLHKQFVWLISDLTLNVLYHIILHQLCRSEMKDVHGLHSFISIHSEESDSLLFVLCL